MTVHFDSEGIPRETWNFVGGKYINYYVVYKALTSIEEMLSKEVEYRI